MAETRSRADSMRLLARVEAAREDRRRAELRTAELAQHSADIRVRDAADQAARMRERRRLLLRRDYGKVLGQHLSHDILALRTSEQQLAERQQAALAEQQAADRLAQAAQATCDRARNALSVVSQRSLRRGRMADTLRRQEALAALAAEEEAVADELMDRLDAVAVA